MAPPGAAGEDEGDDRYQPVDHLAGEGKEPVPSRLRGDGVAGQQQAQQKKSEGKGPDEDRKRTPRAQQRQGEAPDEGERGGHHHLVEADQDVDPAGDVLGLEAD